MGDKELANRKVECWNCGALRYYFEQCSKCGKYGKESNVNGS